MARAANRQAGYRVATSSAKTGQSEKGKEAGKWKPLVASVNNNNNPWTRDCCGFLVLVRTWGGGHGEGARGGFEP